MSRLRVPSEVGEDAPWTPSQTRRGPRRTFPCRYERSVLGFRVAGGAEGVPETAGEKLNARVGRGPSSRLVSQGKVSLRSGSIVPGAGGADADVCLHPRNDPGLRGIEPRAGPTTVPWKCVRTCDGTHQCVRRRDGTGGKRDRRGTGKFDCRRGFWRGPKHGDWVRPLSPDRGGRGLRKTEVP